MNKKIIHIFLSSINLLCFFCFSFCTKSAKNKGNITIEFANFKTNNGTLRVGLYNNTKGFPEGIKNIIMNADVKIENKRAIAIFWNVPYGTYAVSAFQDQNNNGKFDIRLDSTTPQEALFFSNNAIVKDGPAKFDDAKFELKSDNLKLEIKAQFY